MTQSSIRRFNVKYSYTQLLYYTIRLQAFFRRLRCIYIISALKVYSEDILKRELEETGRIIKLQSLIRMKRQYNKYNKYCKIKESMRESSRIKESYELLDYSELLNLYITEIGDSIDKSNIINELYEINNTISNENKLLRITNNNLAVDNNNLNYKVNKISLDNKSYIECVKTNIEKRIELLYKIDEYKIKNEILASKFNDIYKKL